MKRTLIDTLESVDKRTETWTSPDGSTLLVLPYGGRILGLFASGSDQNFLWTHPALNSLSSARSFYESTQWHNSGGDRTWLSPEVDFFLPNFPNLDAYVQPREFDPGNYELTRENGYITLINRFASKLSRSGDTARLELTKRLTAARNPLRDAHPTLVERLQYAGYTHRVRLEFASGHAEPTQVGLWNLLQLPHGGSLLIPTFSKAVVKVYMGKIETEDLTITERLIRYKMRAVGEHKIGLQAPAVIGRVGYLNGRDDKSSLVIRNFSINPSGEYIDVPWGETECAGAAIQACNVNSKLGRFSELEYHVPAIGGSDGDSYCEDESQVWAFRGAEQDILEVSRLLISSDS
jgi:hypothetical protein